MIRVLMYSDAGLDTGFEKMTRGICENLNKDKFEVRVMGVNYRGQKKYEFDVLPADLTGQDQLGFKSLKQAVTDFNPDVIFIIQDIWNIMGYIQVIQYNNISVPVIAYTLPDSPNIKWPYALALGGLDYLITPSMFGIQELFKSLVRGLEVLAELGAGEEKIQHAIKATTKDYSLSISLNKLLRIFEDRSTVIHLGQDSGYVKVTDEAARSFVRNFMGIQTEKEIVLNVNTNSARKRLDKTIEAFSLLPQEDFFLALNCYGNQDTGWDLRQLCDFYGISSDNYSLVHERFQTPMSIHSLAALYKAASVQVNTSGAEGWGLTSFEGARHGTRQLVTGWGPLIELWPEDAHIPVASTIASPNNLNTIHAVVDVEKLATMIKNGGGAREPSAYYRTWNEQANVIGRIISAVVTNPIEPEALSISHILDVIS
jgi:glycosyltransferase involved in cell wall biosynthesis